MDPTNRAKGALTEEERHPLLTASGQRLLHRMLEHPAAPRWNHRCGDRLTQEGLRRVRAYERSLRRPHPPTGQLPPWVEGFARRCLREVPFYRRRGGDARRFAELPTCGRADLGREPWSFVPDDRPTEDLIVYSTSGTTGHPIEVLSHPEVSSAYLALLRVALATRGVALEGGGGRVAIALVCFQRRTYTYASVSSFLRGAAFCKINLSPSEWREPGDPVRFLDSLAPEVVSGDPISLEALTALPLRYRPRALVSTAMALHDGLRRRLEERFGCPVLDVYSLTECRLVAVASKRGHEGIAPDCYVEVLRPDGTPCKPGERGEVALTCGRNPFLPLLRYRTGDWAGLDCTGPRPVLLGLEGRSPVRFVSADGSAVNSADVSAALRPLALAQFTLRQAADRSLLLRARAGEGLEAALRAALHALFGDLPVRIGRMGPGGGKVVAYASEAGETA